jgi:hypothetical protein
MIDSSFSSSIGITGSCFNSGIISSDTSVINNARYSNILSSQGSTINLFGGANVGILASTNSGVTGVCNQNLILASNNSTIINKQNHVLLGAFAQSRTMGASGNTGTADAVGPHFEIGHGSINPSSDGDGIGIAAYIETAGTPSSIGIVTASQFIPNYADYGEYFEWEDGNVNSEDRRGLFVTLLNGKITLAKEGDFLLGIVTETSGVIGNSQELHWQGAIMKDKFDQPIKVYDEIYDLKTFLTKLGILITGLSNDELFNILNSNTTAYNEFYDPNRVKPLILQTNPNYDGSKPYVPRSKRKEWACIGLLGCLAIIEEVPGSCQTGSLIGCNNSSKAIIGTNYRVLSRLSDDTIKVFFRG